MKKRILSLLLVFVMLASMAPVTALAQGPEETLPPVAGAQETQSVPEIQDAQEPQDVTEPTDTPDTPVDTPDTPETTDTPETPEDGDAPQGEEPPAEPEVAAAALDEPAPVAETLSGSVTLSYNQKASSSGPVTNQMSFYLPNGTWKDDYVIKLKAPGGDFVQIETQPGRTSQTRTYTLGAPKAGLYELKVTQPGVEGSLTGSMAMYQVNFHPGEGGQFADGREEASGFGYLYSFFYSYDRPSINVDDGNVFYGWSDKAGGAVFNRLADKAGLLTGGNYVIDLYAVYGTPKTYSFELKAGETVLTVGETYSFPAKDPGYASSPVTFTLRNTGNQDLNFSLISPPTDFVIEGVAFPLKLPAGGTKTFTIAPKTGLWAGDYQQLLHLWVDEMSAHCRYPLQFTVNSGNVLVTPSDARKPFGASWSQDNLKITARADREDGGPVEYGILGLTLNSDGFRADAPVTKEGYPYTLSPSGDNRFSAKLDPQASGARLYVDPVDPVGAPTASTIHVGQSLEASVLTGSFHHGEHPDWIADGELAWEGPSQVMDQEGSFEMGWKFTSHSANYNNTSGVVTVVVSHKEITTLTPPSETSFEYDGKPHALTFSCNREGSVDVQYRPFGGEDTAWTGVAPTEAGSYEVKAYIAANGRYAEDTAEATLTITKRTVTLSFEASGSKRYDGTKAVPNSKVIVHNTVGNDKVEAVYQIALDDVNAGARIATFEVTGLTGPDAANYALQAVPTTYRHNVQVTKQTVTIKGDATKTYGQDLLLSGSEFKITGLIGNDGPEALGATFICAGLPGTADAGTYPITVALNSANYQLPYSSSTERNNSVGNLTVEKATPQLHSNIVVSAAKKGAPLDSVIVSGEFVNPYNDRMVVEGSFRWAENFLLPEDQDSCDAAWVFELADGFEKNYNVPKGGTVTLTLVDREPLPMTAEAQTVVYNGQPQAFTSVKFPIEQPASVSLLYRKHTDLVHTISLFSVGNEWVDERPVDVGTYDVLISAVPAPGSPYGPNSIEAIHLTITPAVPDFVREQYITVPEGTPLSSSLVEDLLTKPKGVDGKPLSGTFNWTTPTAIITEDGETFQWAFTADSGNYSPATGTVTVTLAADEREIQGQIYNLPASDGYPDYAVVDVTASELKEGETVVFYKLDANGEFTDPVSAPVTVTGEKLTVPLDGDALEANGGALQARVTSSRKHAGTVLSYGPEPVVTLLENNLPCDDGEINLPAGGGSCTVSVALQGGIFTVEKIQYSLQPSGSAFTVTEKGLLTATAGGTATLTATVTLTHPDPVKAEAGETLILTVQAKVVCQGVVKDKVQSDPVLSGGLAGGSSLQDSVMTPDEIAAAEKAGEVVDVVLSVQAVLEPAVAGDAAVVRQDYGSVYTVGQYMDIDLTRYTLAAGMPEAEVKTIHETRAPLTIQVRVPETLVNELGSLFDKEFAVIRVHEGKAELLQDLDSDPYTVTFASNLFSTYALVYKDSENVGSLTVSNTVTGNEGDPEKPFNYTLTIEYPEAEAYGGYVLDGKIGDLEFKDGSASFTLKGGESVTVKVMAGGVFTVVQQEEKDYYTTQTGTEGTVQKGVEAKAAFTNKRDILTVTFDGNGGKMSGQGLLEVQTKPDGTLSSLPEPKKEGTYFAGWYTSRRGGTRVNERTVFTADTTLYAHWSKVPLTGDVNNPALWAALLGVSALAICAGAVVLLRRKKKK